MSWVANLMISVSWDDDKLVPQLSDWLENEAPYQNGEEGNGVGTLQRITGSGEPGTLFGVWGGWKNPECKVWAGVLNHADLRALLRKIGAMPWAEPQYLQVFLKDQEDSYFQLWMIRDGAWRQYAPPDPEAN